MKDERLEAIKVKLEWANTVLYRAWGKEDIDAEADIEDLVAEVERLQATNAELLTACNAMRLEMAAYGAQNNWPPSMPRSYVLALNAGRRVIANAEKGGTA